MTQRVIAQSGKTVSVTGVGDGVVPKAEAVDPIPASTVTDIATANAAIANLQATVNTLILSLQNANIMELE